MELTYSTYLKIDELTDLQELCSKPNEHDEMLFIIIHQAYELWFKQIIHELDHLIKKLGENDVMTAIKTQKRINTILKVIVHQVDILETMTPLEFLSFRDYLQSASGFQSYQFRELEFMLGKKNLNVLDRFEKGSKAYAKLAQRFEEKTFWDYFLSFLTINDYTIPEEVLNRDITKPIEPNKEIQKMLLGIYKNSPVIATLCELMVDFDEGMQEWRYRHVKMVERTIGAKMGTGGSDGIKYLQATLFKPLFEDLWTIRSEFTND
ncbi:MAG: tryptophan 2,3-dioxygenase family protein [Ignavibacteriae bacterium]|nr:tryptophan 2,3-dioxygenase family protein [Ignavibacteriota bacterium]